MTFLLSFMKSFKGVSRLITGRDLFHQATRTLHTARIALIGVATASILAAVCLLIISVYFVIQIIEKLSS